MSQYSVRQSSPLRSLENSVKNDSAKLREKLAYRRSILNQADGKLRRPEGLQSIPRNLNGQYGRDDGQVSEYRQRQPSPSPRKRTDGDAPPFRAISRTRERKQAAEMKLKGLFSRSLSASQSDDSYPGIKLNTSSLSSSTNPATESSVSSMSTISTSPVTVPSSDTTKSAIKMKTPQPTRNSVKDMEESKKNSTKSKGDEDKPKKRQVSYIKNTIVKLHYFSTTITNMRPELLIKKEPGTDKTAFLKAEAH